MVRTDSLSGEVSKIFEETGLNKFLDVEDPIKVAGLGDTILTLSVLERLSRNDSRNNRIRESIEVILDYVGGKAADKATFIFDEENYRAAMGIKKASCLEQAHPIQAYQRLVELFKDYKSKQPKQGAQTK